MNDRIRAKPPATEADDWQSGTVEAVAEAAGSYVVTVDAGEELVEVTVTDAIYDLFTGRLDAEEPVGETVWFR